jgi:hypothetical protein
MLRTPDGEERLARTSRVFFEANYFLPVGPSHACGKGGTACFRFENSLLVWLGGFGLAGVKGEVVWIEGVTGESLFLKFVTVVLGYN